MKYRYSVNNDNQLCIKLPKRKGLLPARGKFNIDKNNRLTYWLNEPDSWRREYGLLPRMVFKGGWRLNKNYDLELVLDKTKEQFQDDILVIKGNIMSIDGDILAFEAKTYDRHGLLHLRILKLSVIWLTDETNRLSFMVKKCSPDILTLEGKWQINENQQITYTYEKIDLKTKTKISHTLIFEGFWQISSADKLTYIFKHSPDSKFDFRVQIETPNIYPQAGCIKYRLGIGLRNDGHPQTKTVSLYGTWKFSKKLGLSFNIDYGQGRIQAIEFDSTVYFTKKDEIVFSLLNNRRETLGMSLIFTHKLLKEADAKLFLRLKKYKEEAGIEGGISIPF
jgi:hypothetical protein